MCMCIVCMLYMYVYVCALIYVYMCVYMYGMHVCVQHAYVYCMCIMRTLRTPRTPYNIPHVNRVCVRPAAYERCTVYGVACGCMWLHVALRNRTPPTPPHTGRGQHIIVNLPFCTTIIYYIQPTCSTCFYRRYAPYIFFGKKVILTC